MGDAAIAAAIQFVLETVTSLAADRIDLFCGFNDEVEILKESATTIQAVLADAEKRQTQDEHIKLWLKRLEGVAFEADNVFDELKYEKLRRLVKSRNQREQQLHNCGRARFFFSSSYTKFAFRWRVASKTRDINNKLARINQAAIEFEFIRSQNEAPPSVPTTAGATTSRRTDSIVVPYVVGRDTDESNLVKMLLSPSDKVVSVIPIFGPPGLGKTTLAKSIYNNAKIDGHFNERIWISVAKETEIVELFKFVLEELIKEKVEVDSRNTIVQKIQQQLGGRRYFLVLDDVWNDEQGLWNDFFTTLEGLNATTGSWCLATTRLEQVANTMSRHLNKDVGPCYKLQNLTDDDCWSIIKKKVATGEEVPQELEAIKKPILRRCGGLPLAATLIGGLLLKKEKEKWQSIVEENLLNEDQKDVKQLIKVSFDHLSPISVKNCLVYCSTFPQDAELDKDLLIELWMAEAFLQSDPNNEPLMEARGDEYLKILLQSSLLLEDVNKSKAIRYKMHDLVHEFAKSILNQDRYLALNSCEGMAEDIIKRNSTSLRTLFLAGSILGDVLSKFKCLHVLKLSGKDVKVLPASIGELIHLRILDISDSKITILPESLCHLYNLQTLRIKHRTLREGLPKQMSDLISLRHLHFYDARVEFQMPSKMGRLTHLQTLQFFNVGQEDGRGIEELGTLKYLKGSLEIRNLEIVNGKEEAKGAKLFGKPNLPELKLLWGSGDRKSDNCDESILEGLQPHQNLQFLEIRNFMGDQFPGWFTNLSTLVELKVIDCKRCKELPALGELPSLKFLVLSGLENVRSIGLSFYGIGNVGGDGQVVVMSRKFFPSLKYLSLKELSNLVEWKGEDEVRSTTGAAEVDLFPVLAILTIENCSQLTSAPRHFSTIEMLNIHCNCHVLLLEKIVSGITSLSSLQVNGFMVFDSCKDEHVESLHLSNNLEHYSRLEVCGSVPSEILERLCRLPCQNIDLIGISNLTRLACGPSLERLSLLFCENLKELRITYCDALTNLPGEILESCASLQILKVSNCQNLVSFPLDLQQTPSLEILNLSNCPKLMIADTKGFEFLTSLRRLKIGPFSINETTEFDWSGLIMSSSSSTLRSLRFYGLPHVDSLPEQLQYLTSLTELRLCDFGIEALPDWIENLASLETLVVSGCEKLIYLPSVATMRGLTKLTYLRVRGSPLLKEKCDPQSGPDSEWPKISHIPRLEFC